MPRLYSIDHKKMSVFFYCIADSGDITATSYCNTGGSDVTPTPTSDGNSTETDDGGDSGSPSYHVRSQLFVNLVVIIMCFMLNDNWC